MGLVWSPPPSLSVLSRVEILLFPLLSSMCVAAWMLQSNERERKLTGDGKAGKKFKKKKGKKRRVKEKKEEEEGGAGGGRREEGGGGGGGRREEEKGGGGGGEGEGGE